MIEFKKFSNIDCPNNLLLKMMKQENKQRVIGNLFKNLYQIDFQRYKWIFKIYTIAESEDNISKFHVQKMIVDSSNNEKNKNEKSGKIK